MRFSYRLCLLATLISLLGVTLSEDTPSVYETVHNSNAAILNRLGLVPLEIPDGHHKKRLAGPEPPELNPQSRIHQPYTRRHGHRDSHVYIVKLPASPPYYTLTKPHKSIKEEKLAAASSASNLPMGTFHGNGKPGKIFHWNLPLVKKIGDKKRYQTQLKLDHARRKLEADKKIIKNHLTVSHGGVVKHVRNNDKRLSYPEEKMSKINPNSINDQFANKLKNGTNKMYRLEDSMVHRMGANNDHSNWSHFGNDISYARNPINLQLPSNVQQKMKKHRKKAAMSYYAPFNGKSGSTSIHKNFPGNGKPKAFYVMEKSRKPVYYHPLLP